TAADAGGAAFAGPGQPGLQAEVLRRPAGPRRGLPPGHGVGLADRPVRGRLAEAAPRQPGRGAEVPGGGRARSERRLLRLDQRDLRRRAAVYPAWLHRPGVERRRGAALLGEDRRVTGALLECGGLTPLWIFPLGGAPRVQGKDPKRCQATALQ